MQPIFLRKDIVYPSHTYQDIVTPQIRESVPRKNSQPHKKTSSTYHARVCAHNHCCARGRINVVWCRGCRHGWLETRWKAQRPSEEGIKVMAGEQMEELKTSGIVEEYVIEFLDCGSWYRICISTNTVPLPASAGN
jgi:hypothetical protein